MFIQASSHNTNFFDVETRHPILPSLVMYIGIVYIRSVCVRKENIILKQISYVTLQFFLFGPTFLPSRISAAKLLSLS